VQGVVEEAEALERAAQLSLGREACGRYLAAALVIEPEDSRRALDWLEQAVEADPGDSNAQASLARVAECEEQFELAERAAQAALTSAAATEVDVDPTVRLEAALVGGRCASRRDDLDAAAISFQAALRIDPEHPEALAAAGEALYRSGDAPAARELLEQLLSLDANPNASGAHLVIIGEAHEIAGRDEDALARFEAAIEAETTLATAHAGRVRCLERCGRTADAIDALEGWAATSDDDERSAEALLHAARLELELDQRDAATAHLQQATGHDPTCTEAWCELAELLLADGDDVAALEAAERGAEQAGPDDLRARLDRVRGRAHEQAGSIEAATAAWAAVAASQPRDSQAALEHSRLLRSDGDWEGAAQALADFVARHPEPSVLELASIHLERGRLLAGPLEDVEAAVAEYERALVLDPTRSEARAKLAWLLAQVPGRRPEAVVAQGELLRLRPADPEALRALLRVASEDGSADAAAAGGSILRALGVASEAEGRLAACTARADLTSLAQPSRLEDPRDEQLRTAICELREAFEALPTTPPEASSRVDRTLAEIRAELAAPGLDGLGDDDLRAALIGAAALALDPLSPHAETEIAARLDAAVGRRALRRARTLLEPLTLESLSQIDAAAWRDELRGLAAAVALDRNECDLREALVSLIGHHRPEAQPGDWGDLCALVDASPSARALLTRVVSRWCERIERDIRGNR
jgi:tetratricopeptide (TPR) repeat protein